MLALILGAIISQAERDNTSSKAIDIFVILSVHSACHNIPGEAYCLGVARPFRVGA